MRKTGFLIVGLYCAALLGVLVWYTIKQYVPDSITALTKKEQTMEYVLPPLPYTYDALEPYMDAQTVEIHYTKHHQGYINKLNAALKNFPELFQVPLSELLCDLDSVPESIRTAVRNNGGGHLNHVLFWNSMMNPKERVNEKPYKELAEAIERDFGSFDQFKKEFSEKAAKIFGSGWAWLCSDHDGKLSIATTPGHDVPYCRGLCPLLILDVWEHAYYLKYQNRRAEFIDAWWNLVNWDYVFDAYIQCLTSNRS